MFLFNRNLRWDGMLRDWVRPLKACLPKNVNEMLNMKQKKIQFDHECNLVNLHTFNFIRDLQWNNMEMEAETIPDCVFRFWDQKDFKGRRFEQIENSLFQSNFLIQEDNGSVINATW